MSIPSVHALGTEPARQQKAAESPYINDNPPYICHFQSAYATGLNYYYRYSAFVYMYIKYVAEVIQRFRRRHYFDLSTRRTSNARRNK